MSTPEATAAAEATHNPIEIDNNDNNEVDSAYAESIPTSTTSLTSSILNYTYENGRRYHGYREGEYPYPNDEKEQDRLDLFHHIFRLLLKGGLFCAPIDKNVQRVLDFGTGTGIWALDFADEFPSAEVIGSDLSPIQPQWVAPNCKFVVDDVESPWMYNPDEAFDFIHGRQMAGSIRDWPALYREIYKNLKPGGYVELQEVDLFVKSDDDLELEKIPNLVKLLSEGQKASASFGKRVDVAPELKQGIIDAGFEDVTEVIHKMPIGPWPKDPKQKEIGRFQLLQMLDVTEAYSMGLFTRVLGWKVEEVQILLGLVRSELHKSDNHLYGNVRFVYARKPNTAST